MSLRRRPGGRSQPDPGPPPAVSGPGSQEDPSSRVAIERPRAERVVAGCLFAAAALALTFVVLFIVNPDNQLLGLCLGGCFGLMALAAVVAGSRVVAQETVVEERPALADEQREREVDRLIEEAGQGVSRRRLLGAAAGAAGISVGAALAIPAVSLGPNVGERIDDTPWRPGRRLVDDRGRPILADDVEEKSFLTAYPQGADQRELGSPIVVVRVPPDQLDLPPGRQGWAPEGIMAYSKICTHAGCAIALYRAPLYEPTSYPPALVCPCHYSTFDVRRAAKVVFGPAGRPLPQLPLSIAADRSLVAAGGFSGSIGPAWWSVKR